MEDSNLELFIARFKLDTSVSRKLSNSVKKQELLRLISKYGFPLLLIFSSNQLEEAFQMVNKYSSESSASFGHYELMVAAIQQQNNEVLTNIRKLIALKHDLNTSMIDFGVCLLEVGQVENAEKVLAGPKIYLSLDKMDYIVNREVKYKRPEVLHKLFVYFNDPRKSSGNELVSVVESAARLYGKYDHKDGRSAPYILVKNANFQVKWGSSKS